MYFWKTNKLAESLKQDGISQSEQMKYLLASTVFTILCFEISSITSIGSSSYISTGGPSYVMAISKLFIMLSITLIGILETFKTNLANDGSNYLNRVICLTFPITIKMFFLSFIYGLIVGLFVIDNHRAGFLINQLSDILLQIFYFWRINHHLKYINS